MIPKDIKAEADAMGAEGLEEIILSSGEVVYLLRFGGKVGLPVYLHYVDGIIVTSTHDESMSLFNESAYIGDDE